MPDLSTDLREYFDAMADRMVSIVAEPTDVRSRRSRRQPVWIAAAAVLVVVVLIAGFLVARDSDDASREIHTPANVDASQRRWEQGWQRHVGAVPATSDVLSVTVDRDGILAAGYTWDPPAEPQDVTPAIWRISPGGDLQPTELEPVGAGRVDGVAYWGAGYWASGTLISGGAVTWFSEDGDSWSVVARRGLLDAGAHLVADPLGLIAYGTVGIGLSSDGVSWTRGDLPGAVNDVVRLGDQLVALVGPLSDNTRTVTVWVSRDGLAWNQVADLGPQSDPGGSAIAEWRGGLWAATFPDGEGGRSQLWQSEDARSWSRVAADLPAHAAIDTLTGTGDALVATGFDDGSRPGGWVSPDGLHWLGMPDTLDRPLGGRLNLAFTYGGLLTALCSGCELRDTYTWSPPQRSTPATSTPTETPRVPSTTASMPASIMAVRGGLVVELDPTSGAVIRTVSPSKGLPWHELTVAGPSTAFVADGRSPTGCNEARAGLGFVQMDLTTGDFESIPTDLSVSGAGSAIASPDGSSVAYLEGSCLGTADSAHTLAIRSLVDGSTRRFRLPIRSADDTRWDIIWIGGWAADNRHLLVRVQHEPGYEWWVVDTQQDPNESLVGAVVPASPDEPPGGYVITPLGSTGRWITPVPSGEPGNYDRLVEVDLATGRTGSVLYDWPALTEATQARVVDSDLAGEHFLLILSERGGDSSLYRWSLGDGTPVKVADNINDAGWARSPTSLAATGWVVIDRVDGDRLTVRYQKPHQAQEPFDVLIGSVSRWATSSGEREPLCPGMAIQAVGSRTPIGEVDAQTVTIGYPAECVP